MATNMGVVAVIFLFSLVASSNAETSNKIGINYGQLGDNLPSPYRSIQILQSMNTGRVKLYDANPEILRLLAGTKIQVSVMVPNNEINNIASNQTIAHNWVRENVLQYYPNTMIRFILVGNEILSYSSDQDKKIWSNLVPAMRKIKNSLRSHNIQNIKVGTPLAMDVLQTTSPPSNGTFRSDISGTVILPLLKFLNGTKSFFFIDVYPYFPFSSNPTSISLDYALFKSSQNYTDLRTGLIYHNLLDQMLDSLVFAMTKLNYSNIRLAIAETGWPNAGDLDQPGANIYNAATYNRNLIKKMTAKPPIGTPARPGVVIPTFIFSLYNENRKTGPGTERHWGLLNANGTAIYEIDLSGKQADSEYRALPQPNNNKPYKGKLWCIAAQGADLTELGTAVTFACSQGNGTCDALAPGKACYEPVSITSHASYAFSSYWAKFRRQGGGCYFNGLAKQTTTNPSYGSCEFPSVTL
ncbi:probable glucan endo-1,3-beta-glucosidase A6 isoform X1 [Ricinus communis]|uniref:probable glucan endo-1,3-beta-glucosidase A6 isoform X1 n=1 Tax=Ricinus communis TaxID=3988 RepID=UPI000772C08F|nr:probable glucan endo-1,3-beta-glucosidase A6 isoform X1 [Ricinus communis]|eukprot:XP_015575598.1 probable glucan endo-1,3-beta-glucosidase A6 [Ricinus communis]